MNLSIVIAVAWLTGVPVSGQDPNFHIYLGIGQSNMAGAGTIETQDKTVDSRFQAMAPDDCAGLNRTLGTWYAAVPPLWGCPSGGLGPCDYFGRTMVAKEPSTVKIGVVVVGIPGCDIRLFDKTNPKGLEAYTYNYVPKQYNTSAYAWVVDLAKRAQKDGVIKGILLHQGETMPDSTKWCGQVKAVYDSLIADLKLDPTKTPLLAGELLYQSAGGTTGSHNATINKLPGVIPNCHVISANGLAGKDQYHFNSAAQRTFGARYADTMLALERTTVQRETMQVANRTSPMVTVCGRDIRFGVPGDFEYRITTVTGKLVRSGMGNGNSQIKREFSPGVYFVSVRNGRVVVRQKMCVE